jgi:predicted AAA+ superfamily ATPase
LARTLIDANSFNYFDLEDPVSLARLEQPMTTLRSLQGLVVIDEVQHRPELFPILRVLSDRTPNPATFLILGSASPALLRQSSESLAGRIEVVEMTGFNLSEVGFSEQEKHWLRGGFPRSFLADSDKASFVWRKNFVQTFMTRDLPQMGLKLPPLAMLRLWTMLAHYHGQILNRSELARSMGLSHTTISRYIDILEGLFIVRQLQAWHSNIKKRQVKSPKIYFRDSGLLHELLNIKTHFDLMTNPKLGPSWEGYIITEALSAWEPDEFYFWATHNGAELDLLLFKDGKRIGVECKRADAPRMTRSIHIALETLELDRLIVIYPGDKSYPLTDKVTVMPLTEAISLPELSSTGY